MEVQGVSFILFQSTAALPHKKPASAGTYRDSCRTQGKDKKDNLRQRGRNF
jgi:hypothetical protein